EAYYAYNETYAPVAAKALGPQSAFASLPGVKLSKNVNAELTASSSTDYTAKTKHKAGNKTYTGQASAGITSSGSSAGSNNF
ncbi:MAG: hypothetical protein R8K53_07285, partial [Mariprofundaceae bacterium]